MILTHEYYTLITGDTTSPAQFASAASAAQELLEDELGRELELDERTEQCEVYPDGTIYPSVTPVISLAAGGVVFDDVVFSQSPDFEPFTGFFGNPGYTALTYTGGFDSDTAPECIRRDLAWVTNTILRQQQHDGTPDLAGASSVSVGDVSISYGASGATGTAAGADGTWSEATLRYREKTP